MGFWDDLTWTCHICRDERPDACISVYTSKWMSKSGFEISQNVRYCNDRPGCIEKAKTHTFLDHERFRPVGPVEVEDEAARPGPTRAMAEVVIPDTEVEPE